MKWFSTEEKVPQQSKSIVVFHEREYHIWAFDKFRKGIQLKNDNFLSLDKNEVQWSEIEPPNK
jgi:hypothetical protein